MKMRQRRYMLPRRTRLPYSSARIALLAQMRYMQEWREETRRRFREVGERFVYHVDLIDEPLSITFDESTELKPFDGRVWPAKSNIKPMIVTVPHKLDPLRAENINAMAEAIARAEQRRAIEEWAKQNGGPSDDHPTNR